MIDPAPRRLALPLLAVLSLLAGCARTPTEAPPDEKEVASFPTLTGDYLGQTPPGATPELFAPEIVSTGLFERDMAIAPDGSELFFSVSVGPRYEFSAIVTSRRVDGRWTEPEAAPFAAFTRYGELEPCMAPDGQRLYYVSNRPRDGIGGETVDEDIWYAERTTAGWSEGRHLEAPINTGAKEFFPSVTRDGTLYFTREGEELPTGQILRSRLVDGVYQEPEPLPEQINAAGGARFNASIAPDESFLLLPLWGREDSLGGADYYVVFRSPDDRWSEPVHLPAPINSENGQEYSASISPDGRYLFFMSGRTLGPELLGEHLTAESLRELHQRPGNGHADVYWVAADFLETLRPEGFGRNAG